jgi:hypothetical protein
MHSYVTFVDESDPDFDYKDLSREIATRAASGHWKAATRRLKRLTRQYQFSHEIPADLYVQTLEACMLDRLHGARACESARKILELMAERGCPIPEAAGNFCINNCLDERRPDSTHQGYGGIDTALAIKSALDMSGTYIQLETYDKLVLALAREGSLDESMAVLRTVIVDKAQTPPLSTFSKVAQAAVAKPEAGHAPKVLTLLAFCKAAGYELDKIASYEDGRAILACGVIAAERLDNTALGLRLLTAAGKAEGVAPDHGDLLVTLSSSAAQRASTLIHERAIKESVVNKDWKVAVRVLSLMLDRSLRPSAQVWRAVVYCCAKAEKSKKATSLLFDWVSLFENGKADKPQLSVFNTCMNACEICKEEELTLRVLDCMRKTHETEGNLITFNIALKRLAKQGNYLACEGIIIGMLQAEVEPSVVSYTTAVASCASTNPKQAAVAYEWINRMRSRRINPNAVTYNTAIAACLDGTLEGTILSSKLAAEMIADVERHLIESGEEETAAEDQYTNVLPDASTKFLARRAMEQLKKNWEENAIDKRVATETIRVPLLKLVDFQKSEVAAKARAKLAAREADKQEEDQVVMELEFSAASSTTRSAEI